MSILRDDIFARRRAPATADRPRGALVFVLLLVASALLVLSKLDHALVKALRAGVAELAAPPLELARAITEPMRRLRRFVDARGELHTRLESLETENSGLRSWEWRARQAERQLAELGRLARLVETTEAPLVTARVVADATGPFVRAALLNAGREHGVRPGHPVVVTDGLVGRVVDAGERTSRLLLLTDVSSRIPVHVGDAGVRAVLLGDNGAEPRLGYVADGTRIDAGDAVVTSGEGGVFPRGLRIGTVVDAPDPLDAPSIRRVRLLADTSSLDFVGVLLVTPAGAEAWQDDGEPPRAQARARAAARRAAAARVSEREAEPAR